MNNTNYTEDNLENATLEWLKELGYSIAFGPDMIFDSEHPQNAERMNYSDIILENRLYKSIHKINPDIPSESLIDAIEIVKKIFFTKVDLIEANQLFHKMLVEGVDVVYKDKDDHERGDKVYLLDSKNLDNNDWLAVINPPHKYINNMI